MSPARPTRDETTAGARRPRGCVRALGVLLVGMLWQDLATAQYPIPQFQRVRPPVNAIPGPPQASPSAVSTSPHPSVARITVQERGAVSYGSGTLIDVQGQFGLVVSNWHVVRDAAGAITVEFPGGFQSPAQVVKTDADWDLAALSIRRPPDLVPLTISAEAPRPGDLLAIAGYGSGDYRAAAGQCTQYLAPGENFPYEMLEISAEARQGDSGGPIFNQRGELAGVLFGAGRGFTSGSYGGRVKLFLASVLPQGSPGAAPTALAAAPPAPSPVATLGPVVQPPPHTTALHAVTPPPSPGNGFEPLDLAPVDVAEPPPPQPLAASPAGAVEPEADRVATLDEVQADEHERLAANSAPREATFAPPIAEDDDIARPNFGAIHTTLPPRNPIQGTDLNNAPPDQLLAAAWKKLGGNTLFDQAKTVLAIVGMLSLLVQFWRLNSHVEHVAEEE